MARFVPQWHCRACMGRLEAGTVRFSVHWPGLLPEEKAQGCVLPRVAHPASDIVLVSLVG